MAVCPTPRPGIPTQANQPACQSHLVRTEVDRSEMIPHTRPPASVIGSASISMLALVDRTLADGQRAANAATIVTTISTGVARVVLSVGVVLAAVIIVVSLLAHFAGVGSAVGGAVAVGGATSVAGGRYLWNRRAVKRRNGSVRRGRK